MTSPELTGGMGYNYEDAVVAHYLVGLLCGTTATGLDSKIVKRVSQQQGAFGEPLDDVIVDAEGGPDRSEMRLSLQVKIPITISAAKSSEHFRAVVKACWDTLQKPDFREHSDRVGMAVQKIAVQAFSDFTTVCELARSSDTSAYFFERFADGGGNTSVTQRDVVSDVREILQEHVESGQVSNDQLFGLFQHMVCIRFDLLHEGGDQDARAISDLQRSLSESQVHRARELWRSLRQCAAEGRARAASYSRASLLRLLPDYRFKGSPLCAENMRRLQEYTRIWLSSQERGIGGVHIIRDTFYGRIKEQMQTHRLTLIKGQPGCGKTVLLGDFLKRLADDGTTLFLASNRLVGQCWAQHAREIGLSPISIEQLLVEVAATGHPTLLIDGLDRIEPKQRSIVTDLIGQVLTSDDLSNWKIVATTRDSDIEMLQSWLPYELFRNNGVGYVGVTGILTDRETKELARELPALKPLMYGVNEKFGFLARRPFFAAVLAKDLPQKKCALQSEIDLVNVWWKRGGYDAQDDKVLSRQQALLELAQVGAKNMGRKVRVQHLSLGTKEELNNLKTDGLVRLFNNGHMVQFTHDIFFEWSFFQLLLSLDDDWIDGLRETGEPPALARTVELLSQVTYTRDPQQWQKEVRKLDRAHVRPQWLRVWLIAPLLSPRFSKHADTYSRVLVANDHRLLFKLLVWMQAEKTKPNLDVLSGKLWSESLTVADRLRRADLLCVPSAPYGWQQLICWAMDNIDIFPEDGFSDLITLFEVWRQGCQGRANSTSTRIIGLCIEWLQIIEDTSNAWRSQSSMFNFGPQVQQRAPDHEETRLRALVLRAALDCPSLVKGYLSRILEMGGVGESCYREVKDFAKILSNTNPELLAKLTRQWLVKDLPDQILERGTSPLDLPSITDLSDLSIGGDHEGFFPTSPLNEPFYSLLKSKQPATAFELIRDLTNHAVTAWRQKLRHWNNPTKTPLPIILNFPWGQQEFWGNDTHYLWFRGHGGPQAVSSALMVLESWAVEQIDAGEPLDDVMRLVLDGHTSIATLGIAVHLALHARQPTQATLALIGNQRLWPLDHRRAGEEPVMSRAGLIGFEKVSQSERHYEAAVKSNQMASRMITISDLVAMFVLGNDQAVQQACQEALDDFPNKLPFAFEEDKRDEALVSKFRVLAENLSGAGHRENYTVSEVPGRSDVVLVELTSPRQESPEVLAKTKQISMMVREMGLWNWVQKCFESKQWAPVFSVDEAVTCAREISALVEDKGTTSEVTHGAIAGTAAAVLCFAGSSEHALWADALIEKYACARLDGEENQAAWDNVPWHSRVFVSYALSARIVAECEKQGDREALYQLIAHRVHIVSFAALSAVAACWERDKRFAWCGLGLGMKLAQLLPRERSWDPSREEAIAANSALRRSQVAAAMDELHSKGAFPRITPPAPSWVKADNVEDPLTRSTNLWDARYASGILQLFPVAEIMASPEAEAPYLEMLETLVAWTLETLQPSEDRGGQGGLVRIKHRSVRVSQENMFEWLRALGKAMAKVVPHVSEVEVHRRLLKPIMDQPDDVAMYLLAPFTEQLVRYEVLDAPVVLESTLKLLDLVLTRTVEHSDLLRSSDSQDRIGGSGLPDLLKSMLFVSNDHAPEAKRLANGCWDDLPMVMPLIDRLIRAAGWHWYVAYYFLVLCDRAGDAYSAETFADQVLSLQEEGKFPSGWKGTAVPAKLAELVQAHADRQHPMTSELARKLLLALDALVDLGDRRSAALQQSEAFREVIIR